MTIGSPPDPLVYRRPLHELALASWPVWSSCRDHVGLQQAEYAFVGVPAVQDRVGIPAQETGRCRRDSFQQGAVAVAADDDAGLAVAGEQHAESAGIQVERVGHGGTRERMPRDDHLEGQPLQPVSGLDAHR
jgi:hypothetical protein